MKTTQICQECGKELPTHPSRIKQGRGKFCSPKCFHNSRKTRVKCICEQCGTEFPVKPSAIKQGRGKFCSPKCKYIYQRDKNSPLWKGGKVICICEICGIEFPIYPSQIKQGKGKFCSPECQHKYQKGKNSPSWRGGISFEPYCTKFNNEFKEYIRDKFGRICFLCPKTEEENGERLSVHHVNYDKSCLCNDNLTCQFVPLCRSCNAKVNKNRKEWELKIKTKMRNKLNGWYI